VNSKNSLKLNDDDESIDKNSICWKLEENRNKLLEEIINSTSDKYVNWIICNC